MDQDNKGEPTELKMEKEPEQEAPVQAQKSSRRPDIDLIRIVLTWGILLYHTVLVYTPWLPYYVKVFPENIEGWHWSSLWFIISMNAWNMPMFFFLSGIRWIISIQKERLFEWEMFQRIFRLEEAK